MVADNINSRDKAILLMPFLAQSIYDYEDRSREKAYMEKIVETENLNLEIEWSDQYLRLNDDGPYSGVNDFDEIFQQCCKLLKESGKRDRLKTLAYMINIVDISDSDYGHVSDEEMDLICKTADELSIGYSELLEAMAGEEAVQADGVALLDALKKLKGIGEVTARAVTTQYSNMTDLASVTKGELETIPSVSEANASTIIDYLENRSIVPFANRGSGFIAQELPRYLRSSMDRYLESKEQKRKQTEERQAEEKALEEERKINAAQRVMDKGEALLNLVWEVALCDKTRVGKKDEWVTSEENDYLDFVRDKEEINLTWDDFNEKRKLFDHRGETIDEACRTLKSCNKEWQMKSLGYMCGMGWVSFEEKSIFSKTGFKEKFGLEEKNNMSDDEWEMVMRVQNELGLTNEERKQGQKMI